MTRFHKCYLEGAVSVDRHSTIDEFFVSPTTDGQPERLNQCLEGFLRCAVSSCPGQWNKWLSVTELWDNTSFHLALGRSPSKFFMVILLGSLDFQMTGPGTMVD